ncbi:hypothetical protein NQ318_008229 [Aromia moschata]|uniref:TIL domain-containing protein n=1 Tax=Aromia moschata TaxID=1265417 RepID=A0AAV8YHQ1_9CUCU|nr:hypothetical protein NQ318_008229 [Aromia moschata]
MQKIIRTLPVWRQKALTINHDLVGHLNRISKLVHDGRSKPVCNVWNHIKPDHEPCPDPNAERNTCGSACEATCQNRQYANCIQVCVDGCFCKPDYIKDEESKKCTALRIV